MSSTSRPTAGTMRPPPRSLRLALCLGLAAARLAAWDRPDEGSPLVRRFQASEAGGPSAVWSLAVRPDGEMFIGADRVYWLRGNSRTVALSSGATQGFSSLSPGADGRLWAVATGDLGCFTPEPGGDYSFASLLPEFRSSHHDNAPGNLLAVQARDGGGAWFLAAQALHRWDGRVFQSWDLPAGVPPVVLHPRPDRLWFYVAAQGVLAPSDSGPRLVAPAASFPGPVQWVLPADEGAGEGDPLADGWIVGTPGGVFQRRGGGWAPLPALAAELRDARPTTALSLSGGVFAIATQRRGVLIASREGRVLSRFEGDTSLGDNQVHTIALDPLGDLWAGTATGWVQLGSPRRITTYTPVDGRPSGAVRGLAAVDGSTYVVTTRGVFGIQPRADAEGRARLAPLPATPGPAWTLSGVGRTLLAGGVGGLWEWTGTAWRTRRTTAGDVLLSQPSALRPGRLYFTDGTRLDALAADGEPAIDGLDLGERPTSLVEDEAGTVWVSTALNSVVRVQVAADHLAILARFRAGSGLPAGMARPLVTRVGRKLAVIGDGEVLALNAGSTAFEPVPAFAGFAASVAAPGRDGQAWWVLARRGQSSPTQVFLAQVTCDDGGAWQWSPLAAEVLTAAGRVDQLLRDPLQPALWIGGTRNLARAGPDALRPLAEPALPRLTGIRVYFAAEHPSHQVSGDVREREPDGSLPLADASTALPANTERIRFEYWAGTAAGEGLLQSQLVGLESDWSSAAGYAREYAGLPAGRYEFRVRAIDRSGRIGPVAAYPFTKLAVWYLRPPAWAAYAAAFGLLVYAGLRWRTRALQRQNERLNRMVEERTRELALANSAKMDFLASISHEIRNPLNGVTGLVTLLNDAPLAPRERELARSLAACARSLRRVFDEVLGFARLEEGRVTVHMAPFRLELLLPEVAGLFAAEAAQRGSTLAVQLEGAPPALLGDEEKIRTIIANFTANALKYAPGSAIELGAAAEPQPDGRLAVSLQVRDHGPGIPVEEQELIFRKFVRGSSAERQREPGAGLGLANCQALARLMDAGIGVESAPGQGATFYLQITLQPAAEAAPAPVVPLSRPAAAETALLAHGGRALVVEDQEYNQLVARSILGRLGFTVCVAANGAEARALIAAGGLDLALIDWDVPGAKGDELARAIRAQPDGRQVVVLAVTAHDAEEIRERCLGAGMDGFIVKPLEEHLLRHTLRTVRERAAPTGPSAPAATGFGVFDYLGGGDNAKARTAAREYLTQLDEEVAGLQGALPAGEAARRAHRLRAHAAVVQHTMLRDAARRLQEAADRHDEGATREGIADVARHAAQLRGLLQAYLDRPA